MQEESDVGPQDMPEEGGQSRWKPLVRTVGVVLAAGLALVVGLIGGSSFGGNYAPDFTFWGMPGYEGSGLLAGLLAGFTLLVIGGVAGALLKRRGGLLLVMIGALAAIALGPHLLFPVVPPEAVALALVYIGCAVAGAAIGWGISLLGARLE